MISVDILFAEKLKHGTIPWAGSVARSSTSMFLLACT